MVDNSRQGRLSSGRAHPSFFLTHFLITSHKNILD